MDNCEQCELYDKQAIKFTIRGQKIQRKRTKRFVIDSPVDANDLSSKGGKSTGCLIAFGPNIQGLLEVSKER